MLWFGTRPSSSGVPSGVWKPCFLPRFGNRDAERGESAIPQHPAANLGLSPGMAEGCSFPAAIHLRFRHWNGFNRCFSFRHPAMGRMQSDICRGKSGCTRREVTQNVLMNVIYKSSGGLYLLFRTNLLGTSMVGSLSHGFDDRFAFYAKGITFLCCVRLTACKRDRVSVKSDLCLTSLSVL